MYIYIHIYINVIYICIYIRAVKRLQFLIRLITDFCGLIMINHIGYIHLQGSQDRQELREELLTFFCPDVHAHAGIQALRRARRRSESC